MISPKYVLIGRKALNERLADVKHALSPVMVEGALVASPEDAKAALQIWENVACMTKPFAIVADFPFSLALINDDGSVDPWPLQGEAPQEAPLVTLVGE